MSSHWLAVSQVGQMLAEGKTWTAGVVCEELDIDSPPAALLDLLAAEDDAAMLDSAALHPEYGRYSLLACSPVETLTLQEGVLTDGAGRTLAADDEAIWDALARAFSAVRLSERPAGIGYLPGWVGYVGYEVGRHVERLPGKAHRDTHFPDLRLALYDAMLLYDALRRRWVLVSLTFDTPPAGAGRAAGALRRIATEAGNYVAEPPAPVELASAAAMPTVTDLEGNFTPDEYRRAVARCIEYIAAGDIFQVNLSQRFAVPRVPDPAGAYRALRRRNPAWYAAYLGFPHAGKPLAVLSSSPELFLRLRDGRVTTRPIKGTRPRIGDESADRAAAAELLASEKDNAELAMIIDLLRNDIGRVCRFGSVRVTDPRRLETHPTVLHLVGTVEGRLREGAGPAELLRATFPGGSITGAPKIRAMEIIDELEGLARGVYTGCVGTIGVDGSCEFNIAIRTIAWEDKTAYVQVGGGIVADSTPQGEYAETLDKARAMLESLATVRTETPSQAATRRRT